MPVGKSKNASRTKQSAVARSAATADAKAVREPSAKQGSDTPVAIDRRAGRGRRAASSDRRKDSQPVAVERRTVERREKVNRRRQIDPTTCERDYSLEEIEFMNSLERYKRSSGRMFPTCSEVLEVIRSLGYEKRPQAESTGTPLLETTGDLTPGPIAETTPV